MAYWTTYELDDNLEEVYNLNVRIKGSKFGGGGDMVWDTE